jgi:hypothetical protein
MSQGALGVLEIARLDGERLRVSGLQLARAFFTTDPSSIAPGSFDELAGRSVADRIEIDDVRALNRTMRARSSHKSWTPVLDRPLPWLEAIPFDLDLIEAEEDDWTKANGDESVREALAGTIGRGRGASVATKMLHLKRPRLFPVLDDLVAQMLGVNYSDDATPEQRVVVAHRLILHLREQARANIVQLQAIQQALAAEGINRPLVRILDAILWFSHPATGVAGAPRRLTVEALEESA